MSKRFYAFVAVMATLNFLVTVAALAPDWWRVGNLCFVAWGAFCLGRDKE